MAEKKAIALVLSKEEEAKKALAQCYGVLVLGLGLEDAHHMHRGRHVLLKVKTPFKRVQFLKFKVFKELVFAMSGKEGLRASYWA